MVTGVITFFQRLYLLAGIFRTFKTVSNLPCRHTIFYPTLPAMLWFSLVTFQVTFTWFFMITVLITDQAIHSTGSKHGRLYLIRHLHFQPTPIVSLQYSKLEVIALTYISVFRQKSIFLSAYLRILCILQQ